VEVEKGRGKGKFEVVWEVFIPTLLPEKKIPLEGGPTFSISQFESMTSLVSGRMEASADIKIMNLILI